MKVTGKQKLWFGLIVLVIGFNLLLGSVGIREFDIGDLWPLVPLYFGYVNWEKGRRLLGGFLLGLGGIFAVEEWLGIDFGDVFGIAVALGFIVLGLRLIRSRKQDNTFPDGSGIFHNTCVKETAGPAWTSGAYGNPQSPPFHSDVHGTSNHSHVFHAKQSHSSFIGDYYLTSGRFELQYLHIWHGIGDVRIDLSRAVLTEEEAILDIQALIGNVIIYVPIDLAVSVTASVSIGDLEVLGHHQGGISRQISIATRQYESAPRKVKIFVSLLIGDIDVRYI